MRYFIAAITGILLGTLVSCAMVGRLTPKYDGVDPRAVDLTNEWLALAKDRGITFNHTVSIGFTNIPDSRIIGQTSYGFGFNEIDLDSMFWLTATSVSKMSLLFHELTHAYCDRAHTYGNNESYPEVDKLGDDIKKMDSEKKAIPGYYEDYCPYSLMYPEIVTDWCMKTHYNEYVVEMFTNCEPI